MSAKDIEMWGKVVRPFGAWIVLLADDYRLGTVLALGPDARHEGVAIGDEVLVDDSRNANHTFFIDDIEVMLVKPADIIAVVADRG